AFRLFNPYAFSGPGFFGILPDSRYLITLGQAQSMASGANDWPPNWQWANRTPFLYAWQNMVLWGMGIALGLAGWLAWVVSGWRLLRGRPGATRNLIPFVWIAGYFAFIGGIWVMSMRYYLSLYPVLAVLAAWAIVELVRRANRPGVARWRRAGAWTLAAGVVGFTVLWALMFTNVYRHMSTFTQSGHWTWENVPGDFYMRIDGAGDDVPLINIPIWNRPIPENIAIDEYIVRQSSQIAPDMAETVTFVAPADGTVSTVYGHRVGSADDDGTEKTLTIAISSTQDDTLLASASVTGTFPRDEHVLGHEVALELDQPLEVRAGERYVFTAEASGGPLLTSGAVMLNEPWDEGMPPKVCTLPAGTTLADDPPPGLLNTYECNGRGPWEGLLNGRELDLHWEDHSEKRQRMEVLLDQADYIIIGTNRRYDSQARNPNRWPMTNAYYDALFSGELGFDLVQMFQETFEFGPLRVSDQHLPIYDAPEWLNEFEAEEAFHVYDHPVVFIFQKNPERYAPANTRAILRSVPLNRVEPGFGGYNNPVLYNVIPNSSMDIDVAPTMLMMPDEVRQANTEGGTWSERFSRDSLINRSQLLALVGWWLAVMVFGWAVWPLLFIALPALADRGFGFAKYVGMMVVGWGAWVLATARLPVWSQAGIAGGLLLLMLISGVVAWRQRTRLLAYVSARWRMLLVLEMLALALFLVFIGVRLTNPDLWHQVFGGEKPMNFAQFNGVLRSTVFPAVDPWFAEGYLNYYYFGYVTLGVPTLLLGVVPSVAFNLGIATMFSLTGMAAFSVAFNVVSGWRTTEPRPQPVVSEDDAETPPPLSPPTRRRSLGNPWVAGVIVLLLAVVLGNLDTARVFANGAARLGGYERSVGLQGYLIDQALDDYAAENRRPPDDATRSEIVFEMQRRADENRLVDRLEYQINDNLAYISGFFDGLAEMARGRSISPERWFWGPTRIITEIPGQADGAINEMPSFTFIYGDLHAHMIAMPMTLFVMVFVFNELMTAGRDRRGIRSRWLALFLGALAVGLLQATNTWDYPTYLMLAVLGLGYAWWLAWRRISRWSLLSMVGRIGGLMVMSWLVVLPYTWWFASGLTEFTFWQGNKTPLWAYLDIHGLLLFLVVSLLVWETARWLRSVRVSALRGRLRLLLAFVGGVALVLLATLGLRIAGYPVALVVVPLVAWIGVLFFRPGQSRAMQFVLVLAGLALSITLGTEFLTLRFDNGRQNTIFKFYIQVWLLLSVVGGAAFAWLVRGSDRWARRLQVVWYGLAALLIFIAALFPIMAIRGKAAFRMAHDVPLTLDGMDYMRYTRHIEAGTPCFFDLNDDYQIIRWLQDNVRGTPVIMEAQSEGSLYKYGGRISITTGLPSVVGWDYHQRQQRSVDPLPGLVNQRAANVNNFYTTTDIDAAVDILRFYDVGYIIVSSYEHERYGRDGQAGDCTQERVPNESLQKFESMQLAGLLDVAFQEGDAVIYEVNHDALDEVILARMELDYESESQQSLSQAEGG
ncbi:MAG: DUF2298 domain-containing protein, partial [Phototrophicaceae bacterium]